MSGTITRSRALSETSSRKTATKRKAALKAATKRKLVQTLRKKSVGESTAKYEKEENIHDESTKKPEAASPSKQSRGKPSKKGSTVRLRAKKNVASPRKSNNSIKSDKNVSEESKKRTVRTRAVRNAATKVLRTRKTAFLEESINKSKTKVVRKRVNSKKTADTDSGKRQMSLKESFLNQSKIRPILKSTKTDEKSSPVLKKPKVPVYKSVPLDDSQKSGTEIYDFKFDANDSKERLARKKKKKKNATKKTRIRTIKKPTVDRKITKKEVIIMDSDNSENQIKSNSSDGKPVPTSASPPTVVKQVPENVADEKKPADQKEEQPTKSDTSLPAAPPETKISAIKKPAIKSVEQPAQRVSLVNNSTMDTDEFRPFRPTNVFSNRFTAQNRSLVNNSLLEKSLSPIAKLSENFDPGSPWRPPPVVTFSHVKSLFQSTPQFKCDLTTGKLSRGGSDPKFGSNIAKSKDVMQKNHENLMNNLNMINQRKRKLATYRKFGTEITNVDHSVQPENPIGQTDKIIEIESPTKNKEAIEPVSSNTNALPEVEDKENRENVILNYQTPKKASKTVFKRLKPQSPLKENVPKENILKRNELKEITDTTNNNTLYNIDKENKDPQPGPSGVQTSKSPRKTQNVLQEITQTVNKNLLSSLQSENLDPQPGPSGLQTSKSPRKVLQENTQRFNANSLPNAGKENLDPQPGPSRLNTSKSPRDESRVLRQSNLNSFLNLTEMPESTRIRTKHGIFDDNCVTPVSSKVTKKPEDRDFEIQNAFGFEEVDDQDLSFTNDNQVSRKNDSNILAENMAPVRLPAKDIRNHLLRKDVKEKIEPQRKEETENVEPVKSPIKKRDKRKIDATNFSDTFDVFSETEMSEASTSMPLFVDLEPSHFTQPPKHMYKRKRGTKFDYVNEDEEDSDEEHYVKRKKVEKMNKKDEKRLREWIKSVNQTFDEIDHYDLLVE